jgi:8-amino-7-oxononanoate synthase
MNVLSHYQQQLELLNNADQQRSIPALRHEGRYIYTDSQRLLNVSSNDYLGLAADKDLAAAFLEHYHTETLRFGSSSSRLLTGNNEQIDQLECDLSDWWQRALTAASQPLVPSCDRAALVFNSGYHVNIGLLPALTKLPLKTLILADKLVHASLIDGIQLSRCDYQRYRHNDHDHLRQLIAKADAGYERIIIVTESLFSMDGDFADLPDLVVLKQSDTRIELYIDEAHAVGVFGHYGVGLAEQTGTLADIDYLVGTFGKAMASMGAYVICHPTIKSWLINTMRPLIFSTALPAVNHAWTRFILAKLPDYTAERQRLAGLSRTLRAAVADISSHPIHSDSHIVPYILGSNTAAMAKAAQLRQAGFYALPIRPPTVAKGSSRIRLVLNATLQESDLQALIAAL